MYEVEMLSNKTGKYVFFDIFRSAELAAFWVRHLRDIGVQVRWCRIREDRSASVPHYHSDPEESR